MIHILYYFKFLSLVYMSIVALKRKSRSNKRFAPISGRGSEGFSLNGGHRSHGGIGEFRLISNTTRTPYKGTIPKGNGGNNGKYYNNPLNSGSCCNNDPSIIKKSSMNTAGMIDTKYKWTKSKYPNYWVQQTTSSTNIQHDQGTYIKKLKNKYGSVVAYNIQKGSDCDNGNSSSNQTTTANNSSCGTTTIDSNYTYSCSGNKKAASYFIGGRKVVIKPYAKNYNSLPISQSQYLENGGLAKRECLTDQEKRKPFPFSVVNGQGPMGCNRNFDTWEDAQAAGLLPIDYVG
jgi:hypothetical protein